MQPRAWAIASALLSLNILVMGCSDQSKGAGVGRAPGRGSGSVPMRPGPVIATAVFEVPAGAARQLTIARGGRSIAILLEQAAGRFIVIDGSHGHGTYGEVVDLGFSPDGRSLAYLAEVDGRWRLVKDGQEVGELYEYVDKLSGLARSPTGGSVAYAARKPGHRGYCVIRDGVPLETEYDETYSPVYGPQGKSFAFAARRAGKHFVVKGGARVGGTFDALAELAFAPVGGSLAFAARAGETWLVVRDGRQVGGMYDAAEDLVFSPDGRSLAFTARTGDKGIVVRDGAPVGEPHDRVGYVVFAPQGQSLAFWAEEGEHDIVIRDGKQVGPKYDRVLPFLQFSGDGHSLAWRGFLDAKEFVVRDGAVVHENPDIDRRSPPIRGGLLALSADGRSMVYVMQPGGKRRYFRDGVPITKRGEHVKWAAFSPAAATLVVAKRVGDKVVFERDGIRVAGEYDLVSMATVSADSRRLIAAALQDRTVYRVEIPW